MTPGLRDVWWRSRRKARKILGSIPPFRAAARRQLAEVCSQPHKGVIVHLPSVDWSWMVQRPHHLMREMADAGYLVFFCTPQIKRDCLVGIKQLGERLYLCSDPGLLRGLPTPLVWLANLDSAPWLPMFPDGVVVYDYMDALDVASGGQPGTDRVRLHQKVVAEANLVVVTAGALLEGLGGTRPDVLFIPNAVRPQDFAAALGPMPADLVPLLADRPPVFGYIGAMAEWLDYDLIREVAHELPDAQFVLIGPNYDGSLRRADLPGNVRWLGEKPYRDLPGYLAHFSVAMIPFKINDITRATSPIKLFEYLAADRPVVATPLPECERYPGIAIAAEAPAFASALQDAVLKGQTPELKATRRAVVEANTWKRRAEVVILAWEKHLRGG